tara:strand:+ start:34 stop:270 length:237 start_codon:yes stop_codon:yes gene_type:complete
LKEEATAALALQQQVPRVPLLLEESIAATSRIPPTENLQQLKQLVISYRHDNHPDEHNFQGVLTVAATTLRRPGGNVG